MHLVMKNSIYILDSDIYLMHLTEKTIHSSLSKCLAVILHFRDIKQNNNLRVVFAQILKISDCFLKVLLKPGSLLNFYNDKLPATFFIIS